MKVTFDIPDDMAEAAVAACTKAAGTDKDPVETVCFGLIAQLTARHRQAEAAAEVEQSFGVPVRPAPTGPGGGPPHLRR